MLHYNTTFLAPYKFQSMTQKNSVTPPCKNPESVLSGTSSRTFVDIRGAPSSLPGSGWMPRASEPLLRKLSKPWSANPDAHFFLPHPFKPGTTQQITFWGGVREVVAAADHRLRPAGSRSPHRPPTTALNSLHNTFPISKPPPTCMRPYTLIINEK